MGGKSINLLEKYYKEPNRWGFTFQIYAIFTRVKALQEACERFPDKIKISERSILADKHVFGELMKELGYMDQAEYDVFRSLYDNFETMSNTNKTKLIYLRCKPEKCHERTKLRKRPEEDEIPLEYLNKIHDLHENWFKEHDPKNVLIIDTTEDFKNNQERLNEMVGKLKDFINQNWFISLFFAIILHHSINSLCEYLVNIKEQKIFIQAIKKELCVFQTFFKSVNKFDTFSQLACWPLISFLVL